MWLKHSFVCYVFNPRISSSFKCFLLPIYPFAANMHGLLVILLLSSCAAFHPPAVAVISSRSPHRTISLITRRSSALYSCSQQDDEIPLVLPEIVLEESEAAVSSRETQSDAYKWTGFLLASTAFDVISKVSPGPGEQHALESNAEPCLRTPRPVSSASSCLERFVLSSSASPCLRAPHPVF